MLLVSLEFNNSMKYSVDHSEKETYIITITSSTEDEEKFLLRPINEIKEKVYQHFDQAVKEKLGENFSIETIKSDSGFPNQILAQITTIKKD
jgi:hypothetical protein